MIERPTFFLVTNKFQELPVQEEMDKEFSGSIAVWVVTNVAGVRKWDSISKFGQHECLKGILLALFVIFMIKNSTS